MISSYITDDCSVAPEQPSTKSSVTNLTMEKTFYVVNQLAINYPKKHRLASTNCNNIEQAINKHKPLIYSQFFSKPVSKANPKGGVYCKYGAIQSYDQLVTIIISTDPADRTYNEIIMAGTPCKLTFDLEWCDFDISGQEFINHPTELRITTPQFPVDQTLSHFKSQLFSTALDIFGQPMDESNLLILNSSRPIYSEVTQRNYFKNSFHIYVINYGYLPNLHEYHKQFTQILLNCTKELPILSQRLGISQSQTEKINPIIDDNVYKRNQNFRCVLCTKPKQNRHFMPADKDLNQPINHFFMGWLTEQDHPLNTSKLTQITVVKPHYPLKDRASGNHLNMPQPPLHLQQFITQVLELLPVGCVQNYGQWFEVMCVVHSIHPHLLGVFDQWSQNSPNYQVGVCQQYWNKLYQANYHLGHLIAMINPSVPQTDKLLIKTRPSCPALMHNEYGYDWQYTYQACPRDPLAEAKKNNYWGASVRVNTTDQFVQIDPQSLIDELVGVGAKYDTIVIKAPCGSAKSDLMVKLVTLMYQFGHLPDKFLLLSALRTLAYSLQSRFMGDKKPYGWGEQDPNPNQVNLKLYSEIHSFDDLIDQNINMVINSLYKLADFGQTTQLDNHQRTLIVIDEFKSFLLNLCGGTLTGQRRTVISQLEFYLTNAPYVLVMDQNIDDDCLEVLFRVRDPKKTIILDYQLPNCGDQTVYELQSLTQTLEILDQQYLSQNKLVYICCNTKTNGADKIAEYIQHQYPNYQTQKYTSETPDEQKMKIGNCEQDWISTIIASPTITYGVDHSKKDMFAATFCLIDKSYSLPASMIVQQIRRVRNLIDHKIFICNQSISYWESNKWSSIEQQITQRFSRNPTELSLEEVAVEAQVGEKGMVGKAMGGKGVGEKMAPKCLIDQDESVDTKMGANSKDMSSKMKIECQSMLIKSRLDSNGCSKLKNSWFAQIYRFYYRTELESRQNLINWVRGYLCQTGFKYYVIGSKSNQNKQLEGEIEENLEISDQKRANKQCQVYLSTPIQRIVRIIYRYPNTIIANYSG